VPWVQAGFRGVSFLQIDSTHEALSGLTTPQVELSPGFAMQITCPLYWPPPQRGMPRRQQLEPKVVGQHYTLVPLQDMPLTDYTEEMERLRVMPFGPGTPTAPEFDVLEPSGALMFWVASALLALSESTEEPPSVRVAAWVHYINVCALDMTFDELLSQPWVAAWALSAMELFEAPDGDMVSDSACWHVEVELRKALEAHTARLGHVAITATPCASC
jgi:hypothetical protein